MEKRDRKTFQLGIFVIFSAIILIVTVYLIGQKRDLFNDTFLLRVQFGNVNGLQSGNNVRLSGINVGSVSSVNIKNDSTIEVTMRIREDVRNYIKQNAVATIGTDGLMGNMLVNISPGRGDAPVINDGDLLQTYSRIKTDDILKTLTTTNENAALLTSDLLEIVQDIRQGRGTIPFLLNDTNLRKQVFMTIQNLKIASENTNEILSEIKIISARVNRGDGLAGWLVNDTISKTQIHSTLGRLQLTSLQLQTTADSLNALVIELSQGEGLVPALMKDTAMVSDLRQTLKNLNAGTGKFNEDMEALQHHFLFRKYFKDKEKKQ